MAVLTREAFESLFDPLPFVPDESGATQGFHLQVLLRVAAHARPGRILELYTSRGVTARELARACPDSHVVTVDITQEMGLFSPGGNSPAECPTKEQAGSAFLGTPWAERIQMVLTDPDKFDFSSLGKFGLVYVDGNHTWNFVRKDTLRALSVVEERGWIVWDDYSAHCPQVQEFVNYVNSRIKSQLALVEGSRICILQMTARRIEEMLAAVGASPERRPAGDNGAIGKGAP